MEDCNSCGQPNCKQGYPTPIGFKLFCCTLCANHYMGYPLDYPLELDSPEHYVFESEDLEDDDIIPIGSTVRSYDFVVGKHILSDDSYFEGVIEKFEPIPTCAPDCNHYIVRTTKVVRNGREEEIVEGRNDYFSTHWNNYGVIPLEIAETDIMDSENVKIFEAPTCLYCDEEEDGRYVEIDECSCDFCFNCGEHTYNGYELKEKYASGRYPDVRLCDACYAIPNFPLTGKMWAYENSRGQPTANIFDFDGGNWAMWEKPSWQRLAQGQMGRKGQLMNHINKRVLPIRGQYGWTRDKFEVEFRIYPWFYGYDANREPRWAYDRSEIEEKIDDYYENLGLEAETYTPPAAAVSAAKKGLSQRKKWGRGGLSPAEAKSQGIDSGVTRARKISSGKVSRHDVRRMSAFNRHRKNNKPSKKMPDGGPTAGTIAWNLWGGSAGVNWAKKKSAAMNAESSEENFACTDYIIKEIKRIWHSPAKKDITYWVEHNMAGDGLLAYSDGFDLPDGSELGEDTTKDEYFDRMFDIFLERFEQSSWMYFDENHGIMIQGDRVLYVPVGTPVNLDSLGNWENRKGDRYGVYGDKITSWLWTPEIYAGVIFGHDDINHMIGEEGKDFDRIHLTVWVPWEAIDWASTIAFNISSHWQENELCIMDKEPVYELNFSRNEVDEASLDKAMNAETYISLPKYEYAKSRTEAMLKELKELIYNMEEGRLDQRTILKWLKEIILIEGSGYP